jgi:hypothetical protein
MVGHDDDDGATVELWAVVSADTKEKATATAGWEDEDRVDPFSPRSNKMRKGFIMGEFRNVDWRLCVSSSSELTLFNDALI